MLWKNNQPYQPKKNLGMTSLNSPFRLFSKEISSSIKLDGKRNRREEIQGYIR
jgi:hypothetical protein